MRLLALRANPRTTSLRIASYDSYNGCYLWKYCPCSKICDDFIWCEFWSWNVCSNKWDLLNKSTERWSHKYLILAIIWRHEINNLLYFEFINISTYILSIFNEHGIHSRRSTPFKRNKSESRYWFLWKRWPWIFHQFSSLKLKFITKSKVIRHKSHLSKSGKPF